MKILLFTDSLGAGGAQRQLVGLACMLKDRGYDVKVATYYEIDFYKQQLDKAGVPNELIPGARNIKKRIIAVRSYFMKEDPDWVIAYLETPSLVACIAKVMGCKFRLIVSERNTTQRIGKNERIRFFLYHWAEAIVPNSHSQEKWLTDHYHWMKRKITTITNFVDLNKFAYTDHTRNETPVIMVAASIWASKNTPGLIDAAKILRDKGLKFKIRWYGKSEKWLDYFNQCQDKIRSYGLQEVVELLPKTKEIQKKYQEADYFCLPSFYEGTPNVICEAMASGLPIICSNVCDNPIYVHDGENGYLFDPHNPYSISSAIERALLLDNDEYDTFSSNSRSLAVQLLDSDLFVKKYINLIDNENHKTNME